jgi:hypothetical protein
MENQQEQIPLWEQMQKAIEKDVMTPPVGSVFGPEDYGRGIQIAIDYLTEKWKKGHDTSTAVQLLKKEKMIATGEYNNLVG